MAQANAEKWTAGVAAAMPAYQAAMEKWLLRMRRADWPDYCAKRAKANREAAKRKAQKRP